MKTFLFHSCLLFVCSMSLADGLPRSAPESQGVSSSSITNFVESVDKNIDSLHSFMLVRHGKVVAEAWWTPYQPQSRHMLYSLSKSFTSTAVGMAVAEGKLSENDEVLKLFAEDAPAEPSDQLKQMRIRDLLRMATGHTSEPRFSPNEPWTKTFLAHTVTYKPGTHFLYNTPATYMLSAATQKATGEKLIDYLKPRLFEPLGIENPTWEESPQGISTGGYGLSVRTEDIAKFGQLYLQKGKWNGKQLVPESWIDAATARQVANGSNPQSDWDQGYGYQFWRCRNHCYRGDGAFGQYCIVLPEQDAVIAITSGLRDMQSVLNEVWDKLLPAMKDSPLAEDRDSVQKLTAACSKLSLRPVVGVAAGKIHGVSYKLPENRQNISSIKLEKGADGLVTISAKINGADERMECKSGEWKRTVTTGSPPTAVATSGAWTSDDTFTAKLCYCETPYVVTIKLKFQGNEVTYSAENNVSFGPSTPTELTGKAE